MSSSWPAHVVRATRDALVELADPAEATGMVAYMKQIAPFYGVRSPARRQALRGAWADLRAPSSEELGEACRRLFAMPERELHHSACDLIGRYVEQCDEYFLAEYVEELLVTKSWWDTVDALGSTAVSPLCWRYDATDLVLSWSAHENLWLNRAAIQHQRGWKQETDVAFILWLCDAHSHRREFFIAKAIGWALRDLSALNAPAVRAFLLDHPDLNGVAAREARRGLDRLPAL